jgi:hypothetical protein
MIDTLFEFSYNDDDTVEYSYSMPTETEEEWKLFNLIWLLLTFRK